MSDPTYISLFSGMGGLEHPDISPTLLCESDGDCRAVLRARYASVPLENAVENLVRVPKSSFIVGGWPCQDLSIAGKQVGMAGARSSLFFEMMRVASAAQAHTIVGENVSNLLTIHDGADFRALLSNLSDS